jgi:hypothetical protein
MRTPYDVQRSAPGAIVPGQPEERPTAGARLLERAAIEFLQPLISAIASVELDMSSDMRES